MKKPDQRSGKVAERTTPATDSHDLFAHGTRQHHDWNHVHSDNGEQLSKLPPRNSSRSLETGNRDKEYHENHYKFKRGRHQHGT